ncbi:unnamed protein product [Mytilus edulis]|uniref:Uncharacterized protein n=1 Tax=Mytilus edulis TaxID=6550 RepID=A0A8S3R2R0_MYTED|nr:unnamed protein product [Mytilus edulis]
MTLLQATSSIKTFCLEKNNNELTLKKNHNYFYQCQGLMNICKLPWIDFIVRTTNPYEINIERIYRDSVMWEQNLLPKLKAFFLNAMLPELTHPRHKKYPGIREPGIWYNVSIKGSKPGPSKKPLHDHDDTDDESTKTDFNPLPPLKRNRRKCSTIKFVGRRIAHEWILEDGCKKWFKGLVLSVLKKSDGDV